MIFSKHRGWPRLLAMTLLAAFGLMYVGPVVSAQTVEKRVMVVFPPDNPGNVKASLLAALADGLKSQVHAAGVHEAVEFTSRASSIARALAEQRLTDADVRDPYDFDKAMMLGKEMGADLFLVTSVESYTYDKEKNTVSIILLGQIGDPKTGKLVNTATVTGTASDGLGLRDEEQLSTLAAIDAVNQLSKGLFPEPMVVEKKNKGGKNLLWVILGVAAIVALSSSGDSGGADDDDEGPPPPP